MKPLGLTTLRAPADDIPRIPRVCRAHAREIARLEWRFGDMGDPAPMIEDFLAGHGLPVRDLSAPPTSDTHRVCGAALLVSAAGGAAMIGGAPGSPSPAPAVPDVVAVVYEHGPKQVPTTPYDWRLGPWRADWTHRQHAEAVELVRAAIACGDVYQVNVVGHAAAEYTGDPFAALRRLTRLDGARYAGILCGSLLPGETSGKSEGWAVGCASPETLLEVRGGRIVTRPIKGTAPATAAGRQTLLSSTKERAEHIMIVDLARNDVARVAAIGSVRVPKLFAVRRWADLWQAESDVEAMLRPGTGLAEVLRALCPGGSVTGAPKLAAMAQIELLEPVGRGPAMGALGWVGRDGSVDLGLTIRTVAVDGHLVHTWAGGGITIDSDPHAEVAEAAAKATPVRAALALL